MRLGRDMRKRVARDAPSWRPAKSAESAGSDEPGCVKDGFAEPALSPKDPSVLAGSKDPAYIGARSEDPAYTRAGPEDPACTRAGLRPGPQFADGDLLIVGRTFRSGGQPNPERRSTRARAIPRPLH